MMAQNYLDRPPPPRLSPIDLLFSLDLLFFFSHPVLDPLPQMSTHRRLLTKLATYRRLIPGRFPCEEPTRY